VALKSKLFTVPRSTRLEACLTSDAGHVIQGSRGDHVKSIQIALNQLTSVFLKIDGVYGPKTAGAVKAYKNAPPRRARLLGPGQNTPDDIVGKKTLQSLDDEMEVLENETSESQLVSTTALGSGPPHDHSTCPISPGTNKARVRVQHRGTPINPQQGFGRKINIGGEFETKYLGFEDFVTDGPPLNNISIFAGGIVRPFTQSLGPRTVSNLCMRATPITRQSVGNGEGEREIARIATPGCRLTFASPNMPEFAPFLLSLGTLTEDVTVFDVDDKDDVTGLRVFVITMRGDGRFIPR
jgi:peptidoglycan hydrolase-like protein with peptidoglycan-binding domain